METSSIIRALHEANATARREGRTFETPRFIRIVLREVGRAPRIWSVGHTLEAMQQLVGGNIEVFPIDNHSAIEGVCNDDFLVEHEPDTRFSSGAHVGGTFFLTASEDFGDGREFRSLSDAEIEQIEAFWGDLTG